MKKIKKPTLGAEIVLKMRRGRTMKDKKHYLKKYCCRKTKGDCKCTIK